jgi:hypothetical protein
MLAAGPGMPEQRSRIMAVNMLVMPVSQWRAIRANAPRRIGTH